MLVSVLRSFRERCCPCVQSLQERAQRILGTPALAFPPPPHTGACVTSVSSKSEICGILPRTGSTLPSAVALSPAVIGSTESEDLGPVGEVAHFSTWPLHFFSLPPRPTQTRIRISLCTCCPSSVCHKEQSVPFFRCLLLPPLPVGKPLWIT